MRKIQKLPSNQQEQDFLLVVRSECERCRRSYIRLRLQFQSFLGVLSKLRSELAMHILAMSKETAAKATVDVETSCGVDPAFRRRSVLFDVEDKQSARSLSNNVKVKTSVPL